MTDICVASLKLFSGKIKGYLIGLQRKLNVWQTMVAESVFGCFVCSFFHLCVPVAVVFFGACLTRVSGPAQLGQSETSRLEPARFDRKASVKSAHSWVTSVTRATFFFQVTKICATPPMPTSTCVATKLGRLFHVFPCSFRIICGASPWLRSCAYS